MSCNGFCMYQLCFIAFLQCGWIRRGERDVHKWGCTVPLILQLKLRLQHKDETAVIKSYKSAPPHSKLSRRTDPSLCQNTRFCLWLRSDIRTGALRESHFHPTDCGNFHYSELCELIWPLVTCLTYFLEWIVNYEQVDILTFSLVTVSVNVWMSQNEQVINA